MHILTKVFVLFAAVLSIMLSALTISYTINTDQIVSDYSDAQEEAETARTSLSAQAARHNLVSQDKDSEIADLRAQLSATMNTMRDIERSAAQLQTDLRSAQAESAAANRRVQGALEATKAQALIIEAYKDEVSTLRNNELQAREQMLALEERLSDVQSQNEVLVANVRALRETIETMQRPDAPVSGNEINPETAYTVLGPTIRGSVQAVTRDPATGNALVQIDLGENDRMARNVRVYIVRGSEYISDLIITRTDLNVSTGIVANLRPGAQVRPGDEVKTRIEP